MKKEEKEWGVFGLCRKLTTNEWCSKTNLKKKSLHHKGKAFIPNAHFTKVF